MPRYRKSDRDQGQFLQVNLAAQLLPGTFEHALDRIIDEIVSDRFFAEDYHNDEAGPPAYDPRCLLKVILAGYARGLISSRKLERVCRENLLFMALAGGASPDHSTFANFIGRLGDRLPHLFAEILVICEREKLLGGTEFSLDGLKLPAAASKQWSGKAAELAAKEVKLRERAAAKLAEHREADNSGNPSRSSQRRRRGKDDHDDGSDPPPSDSGGSGGELSTAQKAARRLTRQADRIRDHLDRHGPKFGAQGKEVQGNVTDPDSAKMKTGHGVIQGYNAQALADGKHQIITAALAVGHGQDFRNVAPVMEIAKLNAFRAGLRIDYYRGKQLFADANYHSEINLEACEAHGLDAFIPDPNFRSRDPVYNTRERHKAKVRKKKGLFGLADFQRATDGTDTFLCPAGKTLRLAARRSKSSRGQIYRKYRARPEDCAECPWNSQCLKTRTKNRWISVRIGDERRCGRMRDKIDSPGARKKYASRAAAIEPVFGNIRYCKGMDRFTYRGQEKVNTQWLLYCLVHNIEKIAKYGANWRPFRTLKTTLTFLRWLWKNRRSLFVDPVHFFTSRPAFSISS